jgi:hypothetical protein
VDALADIVKLELPESVDVEDSEAVGVVERVLVGDAEADDDRDKLPEEDAVNVMLGDALALLLPEDVCDADKLLLRLPVRDAELVSDALCVAVSEIDAETLGDADEVSDLVPVSDAESLLD